MPRPDTEDHLHLVLKDFESGLVFVCPMDGTTDVSVMTEYEGRIIDTVNYEYAGHAYSLHDHQIMFKAYVVEPYLENSRENKKTA